MTKTITIKKIKKLLESQIELSKKEIQHFVIDEEYQEAADRKMYIEACQHVIEYIEGNT